MTALSIPALDWKAPNYAPIWAERMRALEALRKEPGKWPALKEFYKHNLVQFVIDFGSTYNPKNVGTDVPPTMPFILFQRQIEFLVWLEGRWKKRKDGVVEKSRDMGCTWLAVAFAVWLWLFWPESVTGFGSRKEDLVDNSFNSDSIFWKIRTFIRLLPIELIPEGFSFKRHSADMRILNPKNGASIIGEAGDNIGRGGRSTLYFKDESAFWEHPEECDSALSQNTNVQIDISTPGGEGIPFWHKVYSGNYDVFVFDWKEDPRKGPQWYADQKLRMTPTAIAQEIDRDHSASVNNSFISGSSVTAAMARGPADGRD